MQRSTVAAAIAISLLFSFAEGLVAGYAPPAYGDQDTVQGPRPDAKDATHSAGSATTKVAHRTGQEVKNGTHKAADKVDESAQKVENMTSPP